MPCHHLHHCDTREEIEKPPIEEEFTKILKTLPREKALGLDDMTSEVLGACWSFIKVDCMAMILDYWGLGALTQQTII